MSSTEDHDPLGAASMLDLPVSISPEMKESMPQRRSLFWDTDPAMIDPETNARYVIERILDFGEDYEIRWMWRAYPRPLIKCVLKLPRSSVHPKSRAFWELILDS